jgi:hypothetical protein
MAVMGVCCPSAGASYTSRVPCGGQRCCCLVDVDGGGSLDVEVWGVCRWTRGALLTSLSLLLSTLSPPFPVVIVISLLTPVVHATGPMVGVVVVVVGE